METLMDCPRCLDTLLPRYAGDVEVDVCQGCGGWWLDRGELEKLIARSHRMGGADADAPGVGARESPRPTYAPTQMSCPRDSAELRELGVAGRLAITVDRCISCGGFWLDAGELDKIVALLNQHGADGEPGLEDRLGRADLLTDRPQSGGVGPFGSGDGQDERRGRKGKPKKKRFFELVGDLLEEIID
jgi:Zn-finger nucleic acid-binding protein